MSDTELPWWLGDKQAVSTLALIIIIFGIIFMLGALASGANWGLFFIGLTLDIFGMILSLLSISMPKPKPPRYKKRTKNAYPS